MSVTLEREGLAAQVNPLGLEGLEFIEYATPRPQAFGQVLESMGFRPVARHRSREVLLYRQGGMNVVVNAHGLPPSIPGAPETPRITALALRVRDAAAATQRVVSLGAWPVPVEVQPMELHIPGVHGVGASRIYFVDRWREFSIYSVDFVPIPTVEAVVPATAGLHAFGVVQYVGVDRAAEWSVFYRSLFGFDERPDDERFGILPKGRILRSPCGTWYLQLIEPDAGSDELAGEEYLQRLAFGTPDVPAAVRALAARGVEFVPAASADAASRGALTAARLGGVMFELVRHAAPVA
jgi:4-hydroxyphenylpyruvate dioxygenase